MRKEPPAAQRELKTQRLDADLCVVGGGLAGVCCALTAAREGLRVLLVQDRPVLGGNASSEVRLWVLGATSHMGNNNRWAREGGAVDELLVENLWRNPEGNPLFFDTILLEKVAAEPNITLLLNTAVFEAIKSAPDTIESARAFCSQNSTLYDLRAPLFCDASGDGILGFLAGAAFRMGAESRDEFGEQFAPSQEYGELLGHSLYFYSKDTGRPVNFVSPAYSLKDISKIPRFRSFNTREYGCRLWWIEWGGRLDTVHDTEQIKWELWKVVYGVWDYIKNSGKFPEAVNLTLEWIGHIPGKRESRRFEGPYMLTQQDLVEQRRFEDAVSYGGWSIDLHPADGIFSEKPGCNQWHSRGVYQIPYRCMFSRNIGNLFLAGRILSASHVAFGSTRVMATCAHSAQAVGMAAAHCAREGLRPADLVEPRRMRRLQRTLLRAGQHIPGDQLVAPSDLMQTARVTASSRLRLAVLPADGPLLPLDRSRAQMLPLPAGPVPQMTFLVHADAPTTLRLELRATDRTGNFTPDKTLAAREVKLQPGQNQPVMIDFGITLGAPQYVFACLMQNPRVSVHASTFRATGLLSLSHRWTQQPPEDLGIETFEMWTPDRRPGGHNLAITLDPPPDVFGPQNAVNGRGRPELGPNAWVADPADCEPTLTLAWNYVIKRFVLVGPPDDSDPNMRTIHRVELVFDTDFDHPMESVLMGHPERAMPFCVKHYRLLDAEGRLLYEETNNHQTRNTIRFDPPVTTGRLRVQLLESWGPVPAALFEIRCYQEEG